MKLKVKDVVILPECQCRHGINADAVNRYADVLQSGETLPNIKVAYDKETGQYFLFDGEHTLRAHQKIELLEIDADVEEGDAELACWWAIAQNSAHGLPRTSADRERAIMHCIEHPMSKDMTEADLAKYVGVSRREIFRVRQKNEKVKNPGRTRDQEYEGALEVIRSTNPKLADDLSVGIVSIDRNDLIKLASKPDEEREVLAPIIQERKVTLKQAEKIAQYRPNHEDLPLSTFINFTLRNPEEATWYFRDKTVQLDITTLD